MTITLAEQSPEGLLETRNSQSAGPSAPGVFASETFDFQLMRWLSQVPYSGSELGDSYSSAQTGAYLLDSSRQFRYDYDIRIAAVVDFAVSRSDEDASRIALVGYSIGGYFGPRDAAFETRLTAVVADCLSVDGYTPVSRTMEMDALTTAGEPVRVEELTQKQRYSVEEGLPRFGFDSDVDDIRDWGAMPKKMTLVGLALKITCPVLNLSSTGEGKLVYDNARAFFDDLPNPVNRFVLTTEDEGAEMQCQRGNPSLLHQVEFDWLDDILHNESPR